MIAHNLVVLCKLQGNNGYSYPIFDMASVLYYTWVVFQFADISALSRQSFKK